MQQHDLGRILELKPQVYSTPFSSIKLNLDSDDPICQVAGFNAVLDKSARTNIIKLSGLDDKSIATIKASSGNKAANAILRQAFRTMGDQKVILAFDGPRITRVVSPDSKRMALSQRQIVPMVEMLVAKGMKIWGMQISPDGTSAMIQVLDPRVSEHPTQKNEAVSIGRSFHWDALGGTSLHDFVQRMWCSNGSTLNEDGKAIQWLKPNMDPALMLQNLFIEGAEKKLAKHFERINRLQEISLSVREWNQLAPWLSKFEKDKKVFEDHLGFNLESIPFQKKYEKRGFKLNEMSKEQLANCPTDVNWWDAINTMTWLGSHPNESKVNEWTQGQILNFAGRQMSRRGYDSEQQVHGVPNFN